MAVLPNPTGTVDTATATAAPTDPVDYGPVPPPSPFVSPDQNTGIDLYTDYLQDPKYELFSGQYLLPVAGPEGTPPEIITLHAPYAKKVVSWSTERVGAPPSLPDWDAGNVADVLQYRSVTPATPVLAPDGNPVYRVSGLYQYVISVAPSDTDSYARGAMPFDLNPASTYTVYAAQFVPGVNDASSATY